MDEFEEKAVLYIFLNSLKTVNEGKVKGLVYKQCFNYVQSIQKLAREIKNGRIKDLKEVLDYGKN